jgi:hypothetical protein
MLNLLDKHQFKKDIIQEFTKKLVRSEFSPSKIYGSA